MSDPTRLGAILARQEICRQQKHPDASWVRRIHGNGSVHLVYWCDRCARAVTQECYPVRGANVSADWLKEKHGISAAELPELRFEMRFRLCQRCRTTQLCEDHHWAPQAVFEDADEWPIGPLCKACHDRFTRTLEQYVQKRIQSALRQRGAA